MSPVAVNLLYDLRELAKRHPQRNDLFVENEALRLIDDALDKAADNWTANDAAIKLDEAKAQLEKVQEEKKELEDEEDRLNKRIVEMEQTLKNRQEMI